MPSKIPAGWICSIVTDLPFDGLDRDLLGGRAQRAHDHAAVDRMGAEHRVRLRVLAVREGFELASGDGHSDSSRRTIPATGIGSHSGRLSSSYWSS